MKIKLFILALLAILGLNSSAALASSWDKKTYFRASSSFRIPGVQLRNNLSIMDAQTTYVFKLLDSQSTRTIVLIYNADESEYLGLVMAIPSYRLDTKDDPEFIFARSKSGETYLKYWYFAGEYSGIEFIGGLNFKNEKGIDCDYEHGKGGEQHRGGEQHKGGDQHRGGCFSEFTTESLQR